MQRIHPSFTQQATPSPLLPNSEFNGLLLTADRDNMSLGNLSLERVQELVKTHGMVVFRGFDIEESDATLISWANRIARDDKTIVDSPEGPVWNIQCKSVDESVIVQTQAPLPLHYDEAFRADNALPCYQFFHCLEGPAQEGSISGATTFVDTRTLLNSTVLSPMEKAMMKRIKLVYRAEAQPEEGFGGDTWVADLVQQHEETGEDVIRFITPIKGGLRRKVHMDIIAGVESEEEKGELLSWLRGRFVSILMEEPRFMYAHRWRKGDFVVTDDRTQLHGRKELFDRTRRMKRIHIGRYRRGSKL